MLKGLVCLIKVALIIAVFALAIIASLYVLDVFAGEVIKELLLKIMGVIGIWTAACLVLLIVALLGKKTGP